VLAVGPLLPVWLLFWPEGRFAGHPNRRDATDANRRLIKYLPRGKKNCAQVFRVRAAAAAAIATRLPSEEIFFTRSRRPHVCRTMRDGGVRLLG
jgi:hypothetical protein